MPDTTASLVYADQEIVGEQRFLLDDSMFPIHQIVDSDGTVIDENLPKPIFTVQEMAKFFFAKSPDWMRWRILPDTPPPGSSAEVKANWVPKNPHGMLVLDGEPLPERRTKTNYRYWTLSDVEKVAHALRQHEAITSIALTNVIKIVKACAKQYGYIE